MPDSAGPNRVTISIIIDGHAQRFGMSVESLTNIDPIAALNAALTVVEATARTALNTTLITSGDNTPNPITNPTDHGTVTE